MTIVNIEIPDKYKMIVSDSTELKKISTYLIEDYLIELYQDFQTKLELENNPYDAILNSKLKKGLGI